MQLVKLHKPGTGAPPKIGDGNPNPQPPIVLTGGETAWGTGENNTQTDNFIVSGAANTIIEGGGNLIVNGSDGNTLPYDTNTTIMLGAATATTDTIDLNGSYNTIESTGTLLGSNVAIDVSGLGVSDPGWNTISLDNYLGASSVILGGGNDTVTLTGDSITGVTIQGGDNAIAVDNATGGKTSVAVAGGGNTISLNGDSTNTVSITGGGHDTITVGGPGDMLFGYTTTMHLSGNYDVITGGDENFNIAGAMGYNTIKLGDGNDTIRVGSHNNITVWGGTDTITTGAHSTVDILGIDGLNETTFAPNPNEPQVTLATDTVNISGIKVAVTATYENMVINGMTASYATIDLGNGNNAVTLGGNDNKVALGDGTNNVFLAANGSTVTVTDTTGIGLDNFDVGNGSGNTLLFDYAGGSVYGTGTGSTTVTQAAGAYDTVTVNLNSGTGLVTLGQGNDTVTANGANSAITAGNGNDNVQANGAGTAVTLGNGNDNVQANGTGAMVTAGNGNDNVQANGASAVVLLGSGNDIVSATGAGSTVTLAGGVGTHSTITVGDNNTYVYVQNGGLDQVSGDAGDHFYLNALQSGSDVALSGNGNMLFLGTDSTTEVDLNHASVADVVTVQADAGNTYGGYIDITNFSINDQVSLQGLMGANGAMLNNYTNVLDNMTGGAFGTTLHLAGGGSVFFDAVTGFTQSEFTYGNATGPVHP